MRTPWRATIRLDLEVEVLTVDQQEILHMQDAIMQAIGQRNTSVLSVSGFGYDVTLVKATAFTEVEGLAVDLDAAKQRVDAIRSEDELEALMEGEDQRPPLDHRSWSYQNMRFERATHEYVDYKGNRYSEEEVKRYDEQRRDSLGFGSSTPPF